MKNLSKPVFLFGCISILVAVVGFVMNYAHNPAGMYVFYTGLVAGGLFWIWAVAHVAGNGELKGYQKMFWLIIVISVPVIGGFLYLILHQQRNRIVT